MTIQNREVEADDSSVPSPRQQSERLDHEGTSAAVLPLRQPSHRSHPSHQNSLTLSRFGQTVHAVQALATWPPTESSHPQTRPEFQHSVSGISPQPRLSPSQSQLHLCSLPTNTCALNHTVPTCQHATASARSTGNNVSHPSVPAETHLDWYTFSHAIDLQPQHSCAWNTLAIVSPLEPSVEHSLNLQTLTPG